MRWEQWIAAAVLAVTVGVLAYHGLLWLARRGEDDMADLEADDVPEIDMTAPVELARLNECPEYRHAGGGHAPGCPADDEDPPRQGCMHEEGTWRDGVTKCYACNPQLFPAEDDFTEEHMERLVLSLTESPESWRRRMEDESASWRTVVETEFGLSVDWGERLALAVA